MSQLRKHKYLGQRGGGERKLCCSWPGSFRGEKKSSEWCITVAEERKYSIILCFYPCKGHFCKGRLHSFCLTTAPCWWQTETPAVLPFYSPQMHFRYFPCCNTPRLRKWRNNRVHFSFSKKTNVQLWKQEKPRHIFVVFLIHLKIPLKRWGLQSMQKLLTANPVKVQCLVLNIDFSPGCYTCQRRM